MRRKTTNVKTSGRIALLLLALIMVLSVLPANMFAADGEYEPVSVSVPLILTLEGDGADAQDVTFTFELQPKDSAPYPNGDGNIIRTKYPGKHSFGEIVFEAPGEFKDGKYAPYEYTVKQTTAGADGFELDAAEYNVSIYVYPDSSGKLVADVSWGANALDGKSKDIEFTNRYQIISVSGAKTWDDNDDSEGARPNEIIIRLYADGKEIKRKFVSKNDDWSWAFEDLPEYSNGKKIVYTVTEDAVSNYTTAISGFDVTNTYSKGKTSVTVTALWNDASDQDGKRPESVTAVLLAGGDQASASDAAATLNESNNWTYTWTGLDEIAADGTIISYSVQEGDTDGYTTAVSGNAAKGYTVAYSYTPETADISVTKVWDDSDDADKLRPASVLVRLLADGEETASKAIREAEDWTGSFSDMPKYKDGKEIEYTVKEDAVKGYETSIEGSLSDGFVITNTHLAGTIEIAGHAIWSDGDDQDGMRPASIIIKLLADGNVVETKTVREEDDWSWRFVVPQFKDGTEIEYTIEENYIEGYTIQSDTADPVSGNKLYNVINSHNSETTDITAYWVWEDDDVPGPRPASVTAELYADDEKVGTATLNAAGEWTYTWTKLPVYKNGKQIKYTVKTDNENGYIVTDPEYFEPVDVSVPMTLILKDLKDNELEDLSEEERAALGIGEAGSQNAEFIFEIKPVGSAPLPQQDGKTVSEIRTKAEGTFNFEVLSYVTPGKSEGGTTYEYTITQTTGNIPEFILDDTVYHVYVYVYPDGEDKLVASVTLGKEGLEEKPEAVVFTNYYKKEYVEISVEKVWDDADDQDGMRLESITVTLYADGVKSAVPDSEAAIRATDKWTYTWDKLAKYNCGKEIKYTVEESPTDGYTTTVTGDAEKGYTITNMHEPETIDISGKKTWSDADDQDGERPASITIRLRADGSEIESKTVTAAEGWKWDFNELPKYRSGKEITYTITEDAVVDYSSKVNGYDVENIHTPNKTSITVVKVWDDSNNQDGIRPSTVTVTLNADGAPASVSDARATLSADNNWTYTWTDLDVYAAGKEIEYIVSEDDVDGYTSKVGGNALKGYIITNTHEPELITINGSKIWDDSENKDGLRPVSITIRLLADGIETSVKTVTEADGWKWSFTGLSKYKDGKEIVYSIKEDTVKGYTTEISGDSAKGYTVTNNHKITPEPPTPQTGDRANVVLPTVILAACLVLIATLMIFRRKMGKREK